MTSFGAASLDTWFKKKKPSFQKALEKERSQETWIAPLNEASEDALMNLLAILQQEEVQNFVIREPRLQENLIAVLSSIPLVARLRFLEILAQGSLPLVTALLDEKPLRGNRQKEALFLYQSIKRVYALMTVLDVLNPENLSLILKILEGTKNDT